MKIFNLVIMTKKKYDRKIFESYRKGFDKCRDMDEEFKNIHEKNIWLTVIPVVNSLKELRKNTWDINRVDTAIKFLTDNFEVKNDRNTTSSTNEDCK